MKIAVIGECMLEFAPTDAAGQYRLGFGGDVLNTAIYMARSGMSTGFFTAIGDGHYSRWLLSAWREEGVDCEPVRVIAGMEPALYVIRNNDEGEREFHYWRSASPFKGWLRRGAYVSELPGRLAGFDLVLVTGISVAMLPPGDRERLAGLLGEYRAQGGRVAFDPNYRARLWRSRDEAVEWIDRSYSLSDIALPSLEDELALRGEARERELIEHIANLGAAEVVMKSGGSGCAVFSGDSLEKVPVTKRVSPVDTTGAGDAFNAGYLTARMSGADFAAAAVAGHSIAAEVVQHRGAIMPRRTSQASAETPGA